MLRVNSPGGTINGSDYMLHYLRKLGRPETNVPIVVSMGGLAASGGYYVSMCVGDQPESIYAEPTTWTGSIGVMIPHFNVADLMEKWGVQEDAVASHPPEDHGRYHPQNDRRGKKNLPGIGGPGFYRSSRTPSRRAERSSARTPPRSTSWPPARSSPPLRPSRMGWSIRSGSSRTPLIGRSAWRGSTRRTSRW